jgi:hypothetical protein
MRLDRVSGATTRRGQGLARELAAKAPQMTANVTALATLEASLASGQRADDAEAVRRFEEADNFRHSVEAIGIMILRAGGLEPDPGRSRELMHQWFDLGSVQESLEEARNRWGALARGPASPR